MILSRDMIHFYRKRRSWPPRYYPEPRALMDWPFGAGSPTPEIRDDVHAITKIRRDRKALKTRNNKFTALFFRTRGVRIVRS